jgi:hypothetical protein
MKKKELPKGFKCECGEWHDFVTYVYAHWDIPLTHVCTICSRVHIILRGKAVLEDDEE